MGLAVAALDDDENRFGRGGKGGVSLSKPFIIAGQVCLLDRCEGDRSKDASKMNKLEGQK